MSIDGRRRRYVPLDVHAAFSKTGTRLLDKWGMEGLCTWLLLLAAAKREPRQGTFTYVTDAEAWGKLGAEATGFTFTEFVTYTGRIKQTRKTHVGRVKHVEITCWGQWNDAWNRQKDAKRKSRKRAQNTPDKTRTIRTESADIPRTEGEVEVEYEVKRQSLARGIALEGLPFEKRQKIDKLTRWCGDHADSRTEGQFAALALELPEGALAKVLESCFAAEGVRNRAGYARNALRSELAGRAA